MDQDLQKLISEALNEMSPETWTQMMQRVETDYNRAINDPDRLYQNYKRGGEVSKETGLPIGGEEKYSKQEPGGTMSAVNVDEIQQAMSEIDEASFRVYNDTLCPRLWDEYQHLDPRVRVNLLRMAYDFYEKTNFKAPIIDIYLMGSAANYNWTPDSDADVHVIIDYHQLQMPPETAEKAVKTAGVAWNGEHKVSVMGHKVEINLQNATEQKPHVTGIYSLVNDKWVRQPSYQNPTIDKTSVQTAYSQMKKFIEAVVGSNDREAMKQAKKYLDAFRQYGLDTRGELSIENIVFKILRARGLIKGLKDAITATYDKEMTVAEGSDEERQALKDKEVRDLLPHLKDDEIQVTVNRDDRFPQVNFVQVDDIGGNKNGFSSNPEHMNKMGYKMPSSEEILKNIPQGRYKLSDVRKALNKIGEVTQKDIHSKFPLPSALYKGDPKLNMMTLDNLKSMREKAARSWKHCQTHEDPAGVDRAMEDFILYDTEMKKRLAATNKSVSVPIIPTPKFQKPDDYFANDSLDEGYGAGIPEEDRLHIPGERWRIKSKDAPKTPKMPKESITEIAQSGPEPQKSRSDMIDKLNREIEELVPALSDPTEAKRALTDGVLSLAKASKVFIAAVVQNKRSDGVATSEYISEAISQMNSLTMRWAMRFAQEHPERREDIGRITKEFMGHIKQISHQLVTIFTSLNQYGHVINASRETEHLNEILRAAYQSLNKFFEVGGGKELKEVLLESMITEEPTNVTDGGKNIMDVLPELIKIAKGGDMVDKMAEYLISQGWTEEDWSHQAKRYLYRVNTSVLNRIANALRDNDRGQKSRKGGMDDLGAQFSDAMAVRKKGELSEQLLTESPEMKTLKKNKKPLTDEERKLVMDSGAVWHKGPNGEKSAAVWKAVVKGKTWYVCNTHRAYQCKPTIKGAISAFKFIKTTA